MASEELVSAKKAARAKTTAFLFSPCAHACGYVCVRNRGEEQRPTDRRMEEPGCFFLCARTHWVREKTSVLRRGEILFRCKDDEGAGRSACFACGEEEKKTVKE